MTASSSGPEEGMADKLDDLVGAIAADELRGGESVAGRELVAQRNAGAVWVELALGEGARRGRDRRGEGPKGFSFEASLTMVAGSSPSSRATSSIGLPGS